MLKPPAGRLDLNHSHVALFSGIDQGPPANAVPAAAAVSIVVPLQEADAMLCPNTWFTKFSSLLPLWPLMISPPPPATKSAITLFADADKADAKLFWFSVNVSFAVEAQDTFSGCF
jgi:hypothetical protein